MKSTIFLVLNGIVTKTGNTNPDLQLTVLSYKVNSMIK